MIKTPASFKVHSIRLDKPLPEDAGQTLTPARVYAAIEPSGPGSLDEDHLTHIVKIDYHPQVDMNTRVRTDDDRNLFVRGIQDIEMRHVELWLLCEEVPER